MMDSERRRFLCYLMFLGVGLIVLVGGFSCSQPQPIRTTIRSTEPKTQRLWEKAVLFEEKIGQRHMTQDGLLAYEIDATLGEGTHPTSFGDMAIWSGCYLATEAFRFQVTGEKGAKERILRLAGGIDLLVRVTGKPGILSRGIRRGGESSLPMGPEWRSTVIDPNLFWLGDVSVDQVNGALFGAGVAYDAVGDASLRQKIAGWGGAIVDHILDHRMTLEDVGGKRTRHGDLTCGFFSEDLNCLIALSAVKVAYHLTGERRFETAYEALVRQGYPERAVSARRPWWEVFTGVNHSDNNLAFLAYYNLIRYEKDPRLLAVYRKSLRRAWEGVREEQNPFFTFVFHALMPPSEWNQDSLAEGMETLVRFPVDQRNIAIRARPGQCVSFRSDRFGRRQACAPLPIDERSPTAVEWNENPYRLEGSGDGRAEFSGLGYLLAYWMGRYHGFVRDDE